MFVRTTTQFAVAFALVAACQPAFADEPQSEPAAGETQEPKAPVTPPKAHFGAALTAAIPLGDLGSATGPALGALLEWTYDLDDRWSLAASGGYLAGGTTTTQVGDASVTSSLGYAPLLGGVRYYFSDPGFARVYALGQAGIVFVNTSTSASSSAGTAQASGTPNYFGSAAWLGVQLDFVHLRAGLLTADLGHAGSSSSALLSLGFTFASF